MKTSNRILSKIARFILFATDSKRVIRYIIRKTGIGDFLFKLDYDGFTRTEYAYGTYHAALQAKSLGIESISVIEFGVAGGKSLLELEKIACMVEDLTKVKINVYGFDAGTGLPEPDDYRDLPFMWQKGFYQMNFEKLITRLSRAKLIIGDVGETSIKFFETNSPPPIGFISFDLDYYSSTKKAMQIFNSNHQNFLPRVFCFFDDCIGSDWDIVCEYTGELLAINEFNKEHNDMKICKINGLRYKRKFDLLWTDEMYVLHSFNHALYSKNIFSVNEMQLPLGE